MTHAADRRPAIQMTYRNWRGEVAVRRVIPATLWYGKTEWHPEYGWLMRALDVDKGASRDFALADCDFTRVGSPALEHGALREMIRDEIDIAYGDADELARSLLARGLRLPALADAPQPAPVDRETLAAEIGKAITKVWVLKDVSPNDAYAIADALLARGLRLPGPETVAWARLVRAAERFAGWTIGGKVVDDPENREKYPLLVAEVLELRAALAAIRVVEGGDDVI